MTADIFDRPSEVETMTRHALLLIEEAALLLSLLPVADEMQWEASPPALTPADETRDRKVSDGPGDPTGNTVADPDRLALRAQVRRSEALVKASLTSLRGVRRGFEITMDRWEKNPDTH